MSSALVVLSGGQDSTTCLYWALKHFDEVRALTFRYGQRHAAEVEIAKQLAEEAGLLIANTPEEFAQQIKRLLDDSDYCRRVGEAAVRLVAEEYDVSRLTARLLQFYNERIDQ